MLLTSRTTLMLTTNVDGFSFSVPPPGRPLGCLVFPLTLTISGVALVALMVLLGQILPSFLGWMVGPLSVAAMLAWIIGAGIPPKMVEDYSISRLS